LPPTGDIALLLGRKGRRGVKRRKDVRVAGGEGDGGQKLSECFAHFLFSILF